MASLRFLVIALVVYLVVDQAFSIDAKYEKSKERSRKKYKTEGSPKEAKHRYAKDAQENIHQKSSKEAEIEEDAAATDAEPEVELEETETVKPPPQKAHKGKKSKGKPYTIEVEVVQEPAKGKKPKGSWKQAQRTGKVTREQAATARPKSKGRKLVAAADEEEADGGPDFIVHVPKGQQGRHRFVVEVPAPPAGESADEETDNAVQRYTGGEEEAADGEEDGAAEEQSMCYYE